MFQLFETIRLEERKLYNLEFHQQRVENAFRKLYPDYSPHNIDLISSKHTFPEGLHKFRISYDHDNFEVKILAYKQNYPSSLKLVELDDIEYEFKYEDRQDIIKLYELRSDCDDIIIIKNDRVTDTSIGNICLEKGGVWYTPAEPLLRGTQRAFILQNGLAVEEKIRRQDISKFDRFMIINAMLPFHEKHAVPISRICD